MDNSNELFKKLVIPKISKCQDDASLNSNWLMNHMYPIEFVPKQMNDICSGRNERNPFIIFDQDKLILRKILPTDGFLGKIKDEAWDRQQQNQLLTIKFLIEITVTQAATAAQIACTLDSICEATNVMAQNASFDPKTVCALVIFDGFTNISNSIIAAMALYEQAIEGYSDRYSLNRRIQMFLHQQAILFGRLNIQQFDGLQSQFQQDIQCQTEMEQSEWLYLNNLWQNDEAYMQAAQTFPLCSCFAYHVQFQTLNTIFAFAFNWEQTGMYNCIKWVQNGLQQMIQPLLCANVCVGTRLTELAMLEAVTQFQRNASLMILHGGVGFAKFQFPVNKQNQEKTVKANHFTQSVLNCLELWQLSHLRINLLSDILTNFSLEQPFGLIFYRYNAIHKMRANKAYFNEIKQQKNKSQQKQPLDSLGSTFQQQQKEQSQECQYQQPTCEDLFYVRNSSQLLSLIPLCNVSLIQDKLDPAENEDISMLFLLQAVFYISRQKQNDFNFLCNCIHHHSFNNFQQHQITLYMKTIFYLNIILKCCTVFSQYLSLSLHFIMFFMVTDSLFSQNNIKFIHSICQMAHALIICCSVYWLLAYKNQRKNQANELKWVFIGFICLKLIFCILCTIVTITIFATAPPQQGIFDGEYVELVRKDSLHRFFIASIVCITILTTGKLVAFSKLTKQNRCKTILSYLILFPLFTQITDICTFCHVQKIDNEQINKYQSICKFLLLNAIFTSVALTMIMNTTVLFQIILFGILWFAIIMSILQFVFMLLQKVIPKISSSNQNKAPQISNNTVNSNEKILNQALKQS